MQIIIPAAGIGSRFRDSRFKEPKPLIKWNHLPMLHHVLDNFIGDYTKLILIKQKAKRIFSNALLEFKYKFKKQIVCEFKEKMCFR